MNSKTKPNSAKMRAKRDRLAVELVPDSSSFASNPKDDHGSENDSDENLNDLFVEHSKKKKKSGGFQSMALSYPVLRGILSKGYKVPTPIQRKTIPLIMEGKDVVGMARTGSGKTAAFVIPMLEKVKRQEGKIGIKALVLSPTRELALQTFQVTKELGKYTKLKFAVILGGDAMETQFAKMHEHPDIIIATPGRLLHVLIEMDARLPSVEYVVFDEADRLFEMGFQEQLNEIINRLPSQRQTLLFSATLPQLLVDFAKAGLHDPELIRLDVELKLSENLKTVFIGCKAEDKIAILVYLLKRVLKPDEMTVIFTATRHHVEFLKDILAKACIECSYVYSALDHEARQINVNRFRSKQVNVILVTDVAARGIDIPLLDNVINFNFPAKPKLFVHRVGRVARAGRSGTAYSLVAYDEAPFLYDLCLFLDRPLKIAKLCNGDGLYGFVPQQIVDEENDTLNHWLANDFDLKSMEKVCDNAYKQYCKTRQMPSGEAVRKMKELTRESVGFHPLFESDNKNEKKEQSERNSLLESLKTYRPNSTIFETNSVKNSNCFQIMKTKRKVHEKFVQKHKEEIEKNKEMGKVKVASDFKDNEFYLEYKSQNHQSEKGFELDKSKSSLDDAIFDIMGDDTDLVKQQHNVLKWDRKKKRFFRENDREPNKNKIKTESGAWISASYKTDLYKKWKERSKIGNEDDDEDADENADDKKLIQQRNKALLKNRRNQKGGRKPPRKELKNKEEILKSRIMEEKKKKFQKWRKKENFQKNNASKKGKSLKKRRN